MREDLVRLRIFFIKNVGFCSGHVLIRTSRYFHKSLINSLTGALSFVHIDVISGVVMAAKRDNRDRD